MKNSSIKVTEESIRRVNELRTQPESFGGFSTEPLIHPMYVVGFIFSLLGACLGIIGITAKTASSLSKSILIGMGVLGIITFFLLLLLKYKQGKNIRRPFNFINPLYFIRFDGSELYYFRLWEELDDVKVTTNLYNGSYSGTVYTFEFNKTMEKMTFSYKDKNHPRDFPLLECLAERLETFRSKSSTSTKSKHSFDVIEQLHSS